MRCLIRNSLSSAMTTTTADARYFCDRESSCFRLSWWCAHLLYNLRYYCYIPHMCADDTHAAGVWLRRPAAVDALSSKISECVGAVASWMASNRLSLNSDKTEVVWCATSRRQHQLPWSALSVDGTLVKPVRSARDLDIYIDADLVMRTHIQRTVARCFAVLRQLRTCARSVTQCQPTRSRHWWSSLC